MLHRTIEHRGTPRFILAAIVGFDLESPKKIVPEIDMWPLAQPALIAESGILDEGYAKTRGESVGRRQLLSTRRRTDGGVVRSGSGGPSGQAPRGDWRPFLEERGTHQPASVHRDPHRLGACVWR